MSLHITYGGTFDPVHSGHLAVARSAAEQLGAVVHLVPCADPPHRARPVATAQQRARMLSLAIDGDARLALDTRELRRAGASYTVDTLVELRAELGADVPIACLLGVDAFRGLPSWQDWRRLFDLAHLVVLTRPGHSLDGLDPALQYELERRLTQTIFDLRCVPAGRVLSLQVTAWDLSSTAIRQALAQGMPVDGAVPHPVLDWIRLNGLYR